MKNCKNCTYSVASSDGVWYCKYTGFHNEIPFPVFLKGGPKKCECYEDGRIRPDFKYPKKEDKEGDK